MAFQHFTAGATLLATNGQLLGTNPNLIIEPWGGGGPTAGYALAVETAATNQVRGYNVPGLAASPVVTVFLVASKEPSVQDLRMLCAILSTDGQTKTNLNYAGSAYSPPAGLALNTYTNAFTGNYDLATFDKGATRLLTAELPSATGTTPFALRLNSTEQSLRDFDVQQSRAFSNTFFLGGEVASAYTWQGTIYACYLYLSRLTEAEKLRTERYLRARFPHIS